jgi:hypothetical protein
MSITEESPLSPAAAPGLEHRSLPPIAPSLHQQTHLALAQQLALERFTVGKTFCRLMLLSSIAAIPSYLLLFILAIPQDSDKGKTIGLVVLSPLALLLLAAGLFAIGFLTVSSQAILVFADDIERTSRSIAVGHRRAGALGSLSFGLALVVGSFIIVKAHL